MSRKIHPQEAHTYNVVDPKTGDLVDYKVRVEKWTEVWSWVLIGPAKDRIMNSANAFTTKEDAFRDCDLTLRSLPGKKIQDMTDA